MRLPAQVRSHTLSEGCALGTPDRAFSQVEALNVESC
ncbi:hypothetical protein CPCC7001_1518 [Cyanobium sp. PCC 7001]|nr:hypothetical protein CPCC7001_1518 [Cyanobium sp. PCC 7001]